MASAQQQAPSVARQAVLVALTAAGIGARCGFVFLQLRQSVLRQAAAAKQRSDEQKTAAAQHASGERRRRDRDGRRRPELNGGQASESRSDDSREAAGPRSLDRLPSPFAAAKAQRADSTASSGVQSGGRGAPNAGDGQSPRQTQQHRGSSGRTTSDDAGPRSFTSTDTSGPMSAGD